MLWKVVSLNAVVDEMTTRIDDLEKEVDKLATQVIVYEIEKDNSIGWWNTSCRRRNERKLSKMKVIIIVLSCFLYDTTFWIDTPFSHIHF